MERCVYSVLKSEQLMGRGLGDALKAQTNADGRHTPFGAFISLWGFFYLNGKPKKIHTPPSFIHTNKIEISVMTQ